MSKVVDNLLHKLHIQAKLLAITSDSASNNKTLIRHLHSRLLVLYNNEHSLFKLFMHFCGIQNHIRYIAHVLNRIVKDILVYLKTGTSTDAREIVEGPELLVELPADTTNTVVKLRIIILFIKKTPQQRQAW